MLFVLCPIDVCCTISPVIRIAQYVSARSTVDSDSWIGTREELIVTIPLQLRCVDVCCSQRQNDDLTISDPCQVRNDAAWSATVLWLAPFDELASVATDAPPWLARI
jgi:hypothetical protein